MSRILFVRSTPYDEDNSSYNVQGIGIAKAFCRLGHDCDYLNFNRHDESVTVVYEENGHSARVINRKRIRMLRTGLNFDVLRHEFLDQYDYVLCREYNQLMTYLFSRKHKNVSMYSGPYWNMFMIPAVSGIYDRLFTKKLNKRLRCKFVKSEIAKSFLEEKGYTDLVNVGVGLDTDRFVGQTESESTHKITEYMRRNDCILYVGTLDENKNLPFIVEVFQKLFSENSSLRLILIGKSKQSLKNKLKGMKDESYAKSVFDGLPADVRKAIKHVDRVDNTQLQFIYPLAKAFMLPSRKEIFGMVMLEAMYFGAPVVTTYNGGSSTLIKSEDYGQVITSYDVDLWCTAIKRYLNDKEYADRVRKNAMELVSKEFTWDHIAAEMYDMMAANSDNGK